MVVCNRGKLSLAIETNPHRVAIRRSASCAINNHKLKCRVADCMNSLTQLMLTACSANQRLNRFTEPQALDRTSQVVLCFDKSLFVSQSLRAPDECRIFAPLQLSIPNMSDYSDIEHVL